MSLIITTPALRLISRCLNFNTETSSWNHARRYLVFSLVKQNAIPACVEGLEKDGRKKEEVEEKENEKE